MFIKPAVLNKTAHQKLRFQAVSGFSYASKSHAVPICLAEFYLAAKEYPIVFVKNKDDEIFPVVVTGLTEGENLFVVNDASWNAHYVPAAVRSYPYAFAEQKNSESVVLIDEAYSGFGEINGIALFNDEGEIASELKDRLKFLQDHENQIQLTRKFVQHIRGLDLLIERTAQFLPNEKTAFQVNGCWIIDEAKLYALGDEELLKLTRQGYIALVTAHLLSLSNFTDLMKKLDRNQNFAKQPSSEKP